MNPIHFPLFCNSQEAMPNCLLIRPLWHDRNRCAYTHAHACTGTHSFTGTHRCTHNTHILRTRCTNTRIHTSICTSNLLVMRSVLSLELREKREDMKERKRDEKRGGQQRKSHVMFSQWRSGCVRVCEFDRVKFVCEELLHHLQLQLQLQLLGVPRAPFCCVYEHWCVKHDTVHMSVCVWRNKTH